MGITIDTKGNAVSAWEACGPVGGLNARDQRSGNWQMGVGTWRTRKTQPQTIRGAKRQGGVNGGFFRDSMEPQRDCSGLSKNARRKAARYGKLPADQRR